jgi:hypothetical protein
LFREKGSGLGMLAIDDDRRGKVLIPCEGNPTARAFDEAFGPGFIVNGVSTDNSVIQGEKIYYTLDLVGVMETFTIAERAPIEMSEEYEAEKKKEPAPRKSGHVGFVEQDDPRILKWPEQGGPGTHTRRGFLPPDHPLYGAGPIVAGRPLLPPPKRKHSENN